MADSVLSCPGCGLLIPTTDTSLDKDCNALTACRDLCYQLTYYTISLQDHAFIHQLVVDTYAAQHVGEGTKPIASTFALVGLYLVNEKGFTGKQVQNVHIALARKSKNWLSFDPPGEKDWLTVADVVNAPDEKKEENIYAWSASVWRVWLKEKELIQQVLQNHLEIA